MTANEFADLDALIAERDRAARESLNAMTALREREITLSRVRRSLRRAAEGHRLRPIGLHLLAITIQPRRWARRIWMLAQRWNRLPYVRPLEKWPLPDTGIGFAAGRRIFESALRGSNVSDLERSVAVALTKLGKYPGERQGMSANDTELGVWAFFRQLLSYSDDDAAWGVPVEQQERRGKKNASSSMSYECIRLALESHDWALERMRDLEVTPRSRNYAKLHAFVANKGNECPCYIAPNGDRRKVPNLATWTRYVRAGEQARGRNRPRDEARGRASAGERRRTRQPR